MQLFTLTVIAAIFLASTANCFVYFGVPANNAASSHGGRFSDLGGAGMGAADSGMPDLGYSPFNSENDVATWNQLNTGIFAKRSGRFFARK